MKPKFKFPTIAASVFLAAGFMLPVFSLCIPVANAALAASSTAKLSVGSSTITLQLGDKNVLVSAMQNLLKKEGYLSATPTGYFGPATKAALVAFQKAQNFPQTGTITIPVSGEAKFFAAAGAVSSSTAIAIGSAGIRVKSVQRFLIQHDLLNIATTTGYFGPATKAALVAFQKAHNLPQTGILDKATFAAMNGK
jgi:peptidoglycan hydrolase-like protein with peptidoglycan-binding domain